MQQHCVTKKNKPLTHRLKLVRELVEWLKWLRACLAAVSSNPSTTQPTNKQINKNVKRYSILAQRVSPHGCRVKPPLDRPTQGMGKVPGCGSIPYLELGDAYTGAQLSKLIELCS
jgi:hypothetical protein